MKSASGARIGTLAVAVLLSPIGLTDARSADTSAAAPAIEVAPRSVEIVGLTSDQLGMLNAYQDAGKGWSELFPVFTGTVARPAGRTMLGRYSLTDTALRFEPRFPLTARQDYGAIFRLDLLSSCEGVAAVTRDFRLGDDPPAGEATSVVQVFPTGDLLPENLLKFYLHFSEPMSRGAYRHVRLLDSEGSPVELPFLEIDEELWNPDATRLTLLFDPGRIKRGVKPREDVGAALREDGRYTLVVDAAWPDAKGRPLAAEFRKEFRVGPPDEGRPDPERWEIKSPVAGRRDRLAIRFDEPLDRAMLERVLTVRTAAGHAVRGKIEVEPGEAAWRFRPDEPWAAGKYMLVVEATLEDRAGNSIGRAFEVTAERADEPPVAEEVSIPLEVGPAR